jgi:SAM-dependent methyltransferase
VSKQSAVLDFGCGEGSLFAALRKAGFTGAFYGVELNASFGEFASRYGDATVSNSIRSREPVDLAIMNHVLEHLSDPIGVLREIASLLKKDGRLYIDVPDAEEYGSIYDLHIAHIYHFTQRTLKSLVEKAGYTVLLVEKHSPPFHPRSVRLVATPTDVAESSNTFIESSTQLAKELDAWNAVRKSGRAINTVRLRLRRIAWVRRLYQLTKSLFGTRRAT